MRIIDIIEKKKRKAELSKEELAFVVNGFTAGEIPDYQMAAFLMAVWFCGMTDRETTDLTIAMRDSGDVLDLSAIGGKVIDKHSTGGVGDKVSLTLLPIVASLGVPVGKMSGRGLGHTGGTIDKLESIPGYRTSIPEEQFFRQVKDIGIALIGQTANLAPADKKMYALRDVIAAVDSMPLIASSIMSKKMAAGADAIVLDVKCGEGGFMKDEASATELAKRMIALGKLAGKETAAVLTAMDEPLGYAVGNAIEVKEAIAALKGEGPSDFMEVVFALGNLMLQFAGISDSDETSEKMIQRVIEDGSALQKMKELVSAQGGDSSFCDDPSRFVLSGQKKSVKASKDGYVSHIHAENIGHACMILGGGRENKEDVIDHGAGIYLHKKIGDRVSTGDVICDAYASPEKDMEPAIAEIMSAYEISAEPVEKTKVIIKTIR